MIILIIHHKEHPPQYPCGYYDLARSKEKGQRDKKRSTEHTHKTEDRVTIDTPSTNTRRLTFVA